MKAPHPQPQSVPQAWYVVSICNTCSFQAPGLFPGDISVQGGVRKWHAGHSCLSRFLASMFVFLFPYSDSTWMEPNLDAGGWFWRSFGVFQEYLSTNVHLRSLSLGKALWPSVFVHFTCCKFDMNHSVTGFWEERFVCNQIKVVVYEEGIFTLQLLQACFQPWDG